MNELLTLRTAKRNHKLFEWTVINPPNELFSPPILLEHHRVEFFVKNAELFIECSRGIDSAVSLEISELRLEVNHNDYKKSKFLLSRCDNRESLVMVNLGVQNRIFIEFNYKVLIFRPPFIGLPNSSVFCYMNSLLQLIYGSVDLRRLMCSFSGQISSELRHIFSEMLWRDDFREIDCQFVPPTQRLLDLLSVGDQQEDATEHLYKLMDIIERQLIEAEKGVFDLLKKKCFIEEIETIKSTESSYTSQTTTNELILRVPVLGFHSLQDAFYSLRQPAFFEKLITVSGAPQNARRTYEYKFGNIILVEPERITFNSNSFTPEKLTEKQIFPELLNVSGKTACRRGISYELQAVISHSGVATAGHYTTFMHAGAQWFEINDMKVQTVRTKNVFAQTGENNVTPYLLLYQSMDRAEYDETISWGKKETLLAEYEVYHRELICQQTRELMLFTLAGERKAVSFPENCILLDVVGDRNYILVSGKEEINCLHIFTRYRHLSDFKDPIEVYEAEIGDEIIVDLFVPGFSNNNCFVEYFCASPLVFENTLFAKMSEVLLERGLDVLPGEPSLYTQNGKQFELIESPCSNSRIVVEFQTRIPDGAPKSLGPTVFKEESTQYYIYSISSLETHLKEQANVEFLPFSDIQLSSNLSRTSDRILELSFGDLREEMLENYLSAHGFESPIAQINKLPTLRFTARFTDSFRSITGHFFAQLADFKLVVFENREYLTTKELNAMFSAAFGAQPPEVLAIYNDIHYSDKPIFKTAGLNFLNEEGRSLRDVLRRPLAATENSSFFEPVSESGIQCSMLLEFGSVDTPKYKPKDDVSEQYHSGTLEFHYRVPLFTEDKLTTLRPYRAIILLNSEPICDYYIHLQRAIDAVTVGDFEQKIHEELSGFLAHILESTNVKHELIFSTQTISGIINHILDEPNLNISEFRGYPMDQNLVFRIDIVQEGRHRFINRLDTNLKPHSFPFCVSINSPLKKELTAQRERYLEHLNSLTNREYICLFYHYFRERIYNTDCCKEYKIIEEAGTLVGVQADGHRVIKDIDLFKGEEKMEFK